MAYLWGCFLLVLVVQTTGVFSMDNPAICCEHVYRDPFCPNFPYISRAFWKAKSPRRPFTSLPDTMADVKVFITLMDTGECADFQECGDTLRILQRFNFASSPDAADLDYNFVLGGGRVLVVRGWDAPEPNPMGIVSRIGILANKDICDSPTRDNLFEDVAEFMGCFLREIRRRNPNTWLYFIRGSEDPLELPQQQPTASEFLYAFCPPQQL